jgi:hypothetical protein
MKYVPQSIRSFLKAKEAYDMVEPCKLGLLQEEYPRRYINNRPYPPCYEPISIFLCNYRLFRLREMGISPKLLR